MSSFKHFNHFNYSKLNICNVCYCIGLIELSNILSIIMFIYIFCHPTYSSFRPGSPPLSLSYGENYENLAPQINFPSRGLYFSMWYLYCINSNLRAINIWFDLICPSFLHPIYSSIPTSTPRLARHPFLPSLLIRPPFFLFTQPLYPLPLS